MPKLKNKNPRSISGMMSLLLSIYPDQHVSIKSDYNNYKNKKEFKLRYHIYISDYIVHNSLTFKELYNKVTELKELHHATNGKDKSS